MDTKTPKTDADIKTIVENYNLKFNIPPSDWEKAFSDLAMRSRQQECCFSTAKEILKGVIPFLKHLICIGTKIQGEKCKEITKRIEELLK